MYHHKKYKEESVQWRYVTWEHLEKNWAQNVGLDNLKVIGSSVQDRNIFGLTLGDGPTKVLMWSQMHGNESTTTKAVLDLVNFLNSTGEVANTILSHCTIAIVPILNPDGAYAYTRVNANEVDLNRDAKNRTQPESKVLRQLFEQFEPDFCFNLHDQRTMFSAGRTDKPATISFLSPSNNPERTVDETRAIAMKLIVAMNHALQKQIPGQVGRYDDGFNENCIGDTFQMLGVPTILFEAGHFQGDYEREETRKYIFHTLVTALDTISNDGVDEISHEAYFEIPENGKCFYDIIITNGHLLNSTLDADDRVGIRFVETLNQSAVDFVPEVIDVGKLVGRYGHKSLDCSLKNDRNQIESGNLLSLVLKINS
ncbi:M14 family metallopeptidase [Flagellimonas myxillae]|uniref:M14 family metallopeptidase n=1 Tax=Flagellimonas myxillae TaxID=2942214 RepID=UPI00201F1042|nr:M14 metallopeptidase family protein [Muricauda myxillae]MCL6266045.1 M14 family metallopeptidase [Muricauda myxillae]